MPINQDNPLASTSPLPPLDPNFIKRPVQDLNELTEFCKFVREHKVRSYLEIGAKYGGSLWHVVRTMPRGSRAVAVDLPHLSAFKRPISQPYLEETVRDLNKAGYNVTLILGDSTDADVINMVRKHAQFDLCLIDANHEEPYVRADWNNYGPMAKMVAFHDIAWDMSRNPNQEISHRCPQGLARDHCRATRARDLIVPDARQRLRHSVE